MRKWRDSGTTCCEREATGGKIDCQYTTAFIRAGAIGEQRTHVPLPVGCATDMVRCSLLHRASLPGHSPGRLCSQ
jgi:hypothetical protein